MTNEKRAEEVLKKHNGDFLKRKYPTIYKEVIAAMLEFVSIVPTVEQKTSPLKWVKDEIKFYAGQLVKLHLCQDTEVYRTTNAKLMLLLNVEARFSADLAKGEQPSASAVNFYDDEQRKPFIRQYIEYTGIEAHAGYWMKTKYGNGMTLSQLLGFFAQHLQSNVFKPKGEQPSASAEEDFAKQYIKLRRFAEHVLLTMVSVIERDEPLNEQDLYRMTKDALFNSTSYTEYELTQILKK